MGLPCPLHCCSTTLDFYQILLNFNFISYDDVAQWSGLKADGKTWYYHHCLGIKCRFLMGIWTAPAQKSEMSIPGLFPTPQKISNTGNFYDSTGTKLLLSDENLSEGSLHGQENLPSGMQNLSNRQTSLFKRKFWTSRSLLPRTEKRPVTLTTEPHRLGLSKCFRYYSLVRQAQDTDFVIEDSPTLNRRGFMLDISRCKVPTMEELFRLIDLLALIGYNELQLYIEHTSDFKTMRRYGRMPRR